jgi:hypothetical protein
MYFVVCVACGLVLWFVYVHPVLDWPARGLTAANVWRRHAVRLDCSLPIAKSNELKRKLLTNAVCLSPTSQFPLSTCCPAFNAPCTSARSAYNCTSARSAYNCTSATTHT